MYSWYAISVRHPGVTKTIIHTDSLFFAPLLSPLSQSRSPTCRFRVARFSNLILSKTAGAWAAEPLHTDASHRGRIYTQPWLPVLSSHWSSTHSTACQREALRRGFFWSPPLHCFCQVTSVASSTTTKLMLNRVLDMQSPESWPRPETRWMSLPSRPELQL